MEFRKLQFFIIASLFNFGLLLQLSDIKYYRPAGEIKVPRTSSNDVRRIKSDDLVRPLASRHASLVFVSGSESIKINTALAAANVGQKNLMSSAHSIQN